MRIALLDNKEIPVTASVRDTKTDEIVSNKVDMTLKAVPTRDGSNIEKVGGPRRDDFTLIEEPHDEEFLVLEFYHQGTLYFTWDLPPLRRGDVFQIGWDPERCECCGQEKTY